MNFYHNEGNKHKHNFTNNYLSENELKKPNHQLAKAITDHTKRELDKNLGMKTVVSKTSSGHQIRLSEPSKYVKYTPISQGVTQKKGAQRIIRIQEVQDDPLAPCQFKHKRIPRGAGSPFITIMHSPQRNLSVEDQLNWKIPPCVSNWKNSKGYTIPLEMRLSADGRTLQQHTVNEKFARFADALSITEKQGRKEIQDRTIIEQTLKHKENMRREEEMRKAAQAAREEKQRILEAYEIPNKNQAEESDTENILINEGDRQLRDNIKKLREREIERAYKLEKAGKSKAKAIRDQERDISEKIALGQAQPTSSDAIFDQRLFNQTKGTAQGFGDEDDYNLYDKPLFADRTAASIYGYKSEGLLEDDDDNENKGELSKMMRSKREGENSKYGNRTKPVEFEKQDDGIFGMDSFIDDHAEKKIHK